MTATHSLGRHRRPDRPARVFPAVGVASCFGAAAVTGWLLALQGPGAQPAPAPQHVHTQTQPPILTGPPMDWGLPN
jgi:hypothetical protein